jgi:hypothetical protein
VGKRHKLLLFLLKRRKKKKKRKRNRYQNHKIKPCPFFLLLSGVRVEFEQSAPAVSGNLLRQCVAVRFRDNEIVFGVYQGKLSEKFVNLNYFLIKVCLLRSSRDKIEQLIKFKLSI